MEKRAKKHYNLAAVEGIEPSCTGVKVPCLTTWRNRNMVSSGVATTFLWWVSHFPRPAGGGGASRSRTYHYLVCGREVMTLHKALPLWLLHHILHDVIDCVDALSTRLSELSDKHLLLQSEVGVPYWTRTSDP